MPTVEFLDTSMMLQITGLQRKKKSRKQKHTKKPHQPKKHKQKQNPTAMEMALLFQVT